MTLPFVVTKMMTAKKASLKMHFNEKMVCNAKVAKIAIFMVDPFFCGFRCTSKVYYLQLRWVLSERNYALV